MTFLDAITAHGLRPRSAVVPDGKWKRCPTVSHPRKRNGSYSLAIGGRVGSYIDFARDTEHHTWRAEQPDAVERYDPSWLKRAREQQAEQRRRQREATVQARQFYEACKPLRNGHPYLAKHGLDMTGAHGLRVDGKGWLVVPAYRGRELMTVQRISPAGDKRFWPGAPVKGASYPIERRRAVLTVLCEGLATGLAIFAAVAGSQVVVAFHSGNLAHMKPPSGLVVIAADNDWKTVCPRHRELGFPLPFEPWEDRPEWCRCNPGRCAAAEAAEQFGCGVAFPDGIEGTDFADWRMETFNARLAERMPRQREAEIRSAVDVRLEMSIRSNARFIAPQLA